MERKAQITEWQYFCKTHMPWCSPGTSGSVVNPGTLRRVTHVSPDRGNSHKVKASPMLNWRKIRKRLIITTILTWPPGSWLHSDQPRLCPGACTWYWWSHPRAAWVLSAPGTWCLCSVFHVSHLSQCLTWPGDRARSVPAPRTPAPRTRPAWPGPAGTRPRGWWRRSDSRRWPRPPRGQGAPSGPGAASARRRTSTVSPSSDSESLQQVLIRCWTKAW